jgi:hypothetical protein
MRVQQILLTNAALFATVALTTALLSAAHLDTV